MEAAFYNSEIESISYNKHFEKGIAKFRKLKSLDVLAFFGTKIRMVDAISI